MRKTIAAATVAASLTAGTFAGAALGAPVIAGAADATGEAAGWVQEALDGLVDDGTITEGQADAVETALEEARPERGPGRRFAHRAHVALSAAADALGISETELRDALAEGRTMAEVADAQGVDVQSVVDALVAEKQARIADAVADGRLTQDQADEILAEVVERVTARVNGERPEPGFHGPRGPRHRIGAGN